MAAGTWLEVKTLPAFFFARYALGGVHSKISMTPFKFADYQEFERRKGYDESIHLEK